MLTSAQKAVIDEVVYNRLIEYLEDVDVSRRIFVPNFMDEGDSVKIVREGQWPAAAEVAEGAEVPIYSPEYTEEFESYKKVAYRTQITHEMITDSRWDLVRRGARKAGQKIGLKVSQDVIEEAKDYAAWSYTVSGRWGGANADEIGDISTNIGVLDAALYNVDLIVMHPKDYAHLRALPEYIEKQMGGAGIKNWDGGTTVLGQAIVKTTQISENNFLLMDSDEAGILFIREDLRSESYSDVTRDVEGQVFFLRYREATISPSAIVFATGY